MYQNGTLTTLQLIYSRLFCLPLILGSFRVLDSLHRCEMHCLVVGSIAMSFELIEKERMLRNAFYRFRGMVSFVKNVLRASRPKPP
jgi:hypothetical protein